ncbi:MAG: WYL domain-containing protein [Pseudomonadales bacterium]|nr:WYL domain-containing protein [Pseudomonadales bacterium]
MARDVYATVRRLRVLSCLPSDAADGITVEEIVRRVLGQVHDDVPVTAKRVREDLKYLSEVGHFPIADDGRVRDRRLWWDSPTLFQVPQMGVDTALTFALMRDQVSPLLPASVLASVRRHFQRADETLRLPSARRAAAWKHKVRIVPRHLEPIPAPVDPGVMECVYQALLEERMLEVRYRAARGSRTRVHTLAPLGLLFRGGVTELVATAQGQPEPARFHLHRMSGACVLERTAPRPRGFDLDRFVEEGLAFPMDGSPIELVLDIRGDRVRELTETRLARGQTIEPLDDGWSRLRARVRNTDRLLRWILSCGRTVRVVAPEAVRSEVQRHVLEAASYYEAAAT